MDKTKKSKLDVKSKERERFIEELISETQADFLERQKDRLFLERQWELNMNFLAGNQYYGINGRGDLTYEDKSFYWQNRGVFNHIAPIIETRLSKLARVKGKVSVRPKSDDDEDVKSADLAEKLVAEAFAKNNMEQVIKQVNSWCESCGTGFYKVIWNNDGGNKIGVLDGVDVFEGEVQILAVSPFEIFPDNLYVEDLQECSSIIHAKAVPVSLVKEKYGVDIIGEEIDVNDLKVTNSTSKSQKTDKKKLKDAVIVIEKYVAPNCDYPEGRLITVAGGKLLYYGEMPYVSGENGLRAYPFIKQEANIQSGSFFGSSVIERLIPVQRAFNAVKNRKHEFLNRLSNGVMTVEDGSVDIDDLSEDGLSPGKILVYRQGAKAPEMMDVNSIPSDFSDEEQKLINEFTIISGVSDVTSSSNNANVSSGTALQILIDQDNQRLTMTADIIRRALVDVAKQVLRLYQQFLSGLKAIKFIDEFEKTKIYYADKKTALSDDVYMESENELLYTESQKKDMVLKLYESGLLNSENGQINTATKEKVLSLLGYKDLDYQKGLSRLHQEKAQSENETIRKKGLLIDEIDNHQIHVDEHVRYFLSEHDEFKEEERQRFFEHVKLHQEQLNRKQEKTED